MKPRDTSRGFCILRVKEMAMYQKVMAASEVTPVNLDFPGASIQVLDTDECRRRGIEG